MVRCDGVGVPPQPSGPWNKGTPRPLSPELTWERHAVKSPPIQHQLHLGPTAQVIHGQNDLIPGEVRFWQARQRPSTW